MPIFSFQAGSRGRCVFRDIRLSDNTNNRTRAEGTPLLGARLLPAEGTANISGSVCHVRRLDPYCLSCFAAFGTEGFWEIAGCLVCLLLKYSVLPVVRLFCTQL